MSSSIPRASCFSDARARNARELSETQSWTAYPSRRSFACSALARPEKVWFICASNFITRSSESFFARSVLRIVLTSSGQSSRPFAAAYHAEKATASRHKLSESCGCAARRKSQEAACGMEIWSLDDMKRASVFVWEYRDRRTHDIHLAS